MSFLREILKQVQDDNYKSKLTAEDSSYFKKSITLLINHSLS